MKKFTKFTDFIVFESKMQELYIYVKMKPKYLIVDELCVYLKLDMKYYMQI